MQREKIGREDNTIYERKDMDNDRNSKERYDYDRGLSYVNSSDRR